MVQLDEFTFLGSAFWTGRLASFVGKATMEAVDKIIGVCNKSVLSLGYVSSLFSSLGLENVVETRILVHMLSFSCLRDERSLVCDVVFYSLNYIIFCSCVFLAVGTSKRVGYSNGECVVAW